MPCKITLYHDTVYSGLAQTYTSSTRNLTDNNKPFNKNYASWQKVQADESCAITAYTYPNFNYDGDTVSNQQTQRSVITREGEDNIYNQSGGVGSTGRNFNDDYDSIRIQTVPSAGANEMQFHINTVSQVPFSATDPKSIGNNEVYYDRTNKIRPCPGGTAYFNSKSGVRCIYPKTGEAGATSLRTLNEATKASNMDTMYSSLADKFCEDSNNVFERPGAQTCLERSAGAALAVKYCEVGKRIKGAAGKADGGDENCSADLNSLGSNYAAVAEKYCKTPTGRADTFCKCYNVTNGICDAHPTAAGCPKKKETFDKLVAATPSGQKDVWSGMESCFGRVCTGTGVFIPPNSNQNCDKSVNVCIQDIDIGSMTDSNITPVCDIKSGDGSPSVSEPQTSSQLSAQEEIDEAKAAVARGDPGAQEKLDAAEAALDAADESAGETGPKAYIPKSLDGLKNDRKQQIGAGVMGALVLGCMMMLLLLVASAGGGGGGPAKRRFR